MAATERVIGSGVRHACTINEPNVVAAFDAVIHLGAAQAQGEGEGEEGQAAPAAGMPLPDGKVTAALIESHGRAVAAVKAMSPDIQVGWSVANQVFQATPGAEDIAAAYRYPREDVFIEAACQDDWIGVQAYTRTRVGPDGPLPVPDAAERTLTGWEYYPYALGHALRHTAQVVGDVPLIVTENGIATGDASRRIAYTATALRDLAAALDDGLDIRGYLHWSALDNYEWGSYAPTFGLIAVAPRTFARAPKPSAAWLGEIARSRLLPRGA